MYAINIEPGRIAPVATYARFVAVVNGASASASGASTAGVSDGDQTTLRYHECYRNGVLTNTSLWGDEAHESGAAMTSGIEYEAKVLDIDPDAVVGRILRAGGVHVADRLLRRHVYDIRCPKADRGRFKVFR